MALDLRNFRRLMETYPQQLQSQIFQSQQVKDWLLKSLIEQSHWGEQQMGIQRESRYGAAQDRMLAVAQAMCKDQPYPDECMRQILQRLPEFQGRFPAPSADLPAKQDQFQAALAEAITSNFTDPTTGAVQAPANIGEILPSLTGGMGLPATLGVIESGKKTAMDTAKLKTREAELTEKGATRAQREIERLDRLKVFDQRVKEYELRQNQLQQRIAEHEVGGKGKDPKLENFLKQVDLALKNITVAQKKNDEDVTEGSEKALVNAFEGFDKVFSKADRHLKEAEYEALVQALISGPFDPPYTEAEARQKAKEKLGIQ